MTSILKMHYEKHPTVMDNYLNMEEQRTDFIHDFVPM